MKCLYCDKEIKKYSLYSLFLEDDSLCLECRKKLNLKRKSFKVNGIKAESFYEYDSLFKTLLIQYKECYDEALCKVFLYKIDAYISLKYLGYKILYVPSSKEKLSQRGFKHLELIFKPLGLKELNGLHMKQELIQEGKNSNERSKMEDNYYYDGPYCRRVLIVDDVYTTGSSIKGVIKALNGRYGKLRVITLAKSGDKKKGLSLGK